MNHNIKTIIFDLDGTLLDTLHDLTASVNYALSAKDLPQRSTDEVRQFVGNGIKKLIERAVPEHTASDLLDTVFSTFKAHYALHSMDHTQCYAGVLDTLAELKKRGYQIAIASNKINSAVQDLNKQFFQRHTAYAIGESKGLDRKPAPDMILHCMAQLQSTPADTLYIGDSEVDILTARNAGIPIVSVTWGFRDRDLLESLQPEYIINHPSELLDILR